MREIISIGIGSFGVRMAQPLWEKLYDEHGLDNKGKVKDEGGGDKNVMFREGSSSSVFTPRTVLLDCQDYPMSEVKKTGLLSPHQMVHRQEAGIYFTRSAYTVGRDVTDEAEDSFRKQAEACDRLTGVIFQHTLTGASGSGLPSKLLWKVHNSYPKVNTILVSVLPSPNIANSCLEPYQFVHGLAEYLYHSSRTCMLCIDNEKMYRLAQEKAGVQDPSFSDINKIVANLISKTTIRDRFYQSVNGGIDDLICNLVPYPRLNFISPSLSHPIDESYIQAKDQNEAQLIDESISGSSSLNSNDFSRGKYLSLAVLGDGLAGPAFHAKMGQRLQNSSLDLKSCCKKLYLQDNCRYGFSLTNQFKILQLANHTSINSFFKSISRKYDRLFSKRSFYHFYVGEGVDSGFAYQARENLSGIIRDYQEIDTL